MKEKERYIIDRFDGDIFDTKKEYYPSNQTICEIINQQDKQINQLKQQLHDLPNKIVGEIKKELYDCGKTYLEDEPYIEICIIKGILDRILKSMEGEKNEKHGNV